MPATLMRRDLGERMKHVSVVDVTGLRRLKGALNLASHAAQVFAGLLLLVGLFDYRLLVVGPLTLWGARRAWRGDVIALALLTSAALLGAGIFVREYALVTERFTESAVQAAFHRANAIVVGIFVAFAIVFAVASGAAVWLRGSLPKVAKSRRRCALRALAVMFRRHWLRAAAWYAMSVLFALVGLGPAIIEIGSTLLPVPRVLQESVDIARRPAWQIALMVIIIFGSAWLAIASYGRAKRLAAKAAREVLRDDPRPPVLLLRSFGDDITPIARTSDAWGWARAALSRNLWTLEETMEHVLRSYGPVIAVGRPGEALPPAGAAGEYIANAAWRSRVATYIQDAQMIVVMLGRGTGLEDEYAMLHRLDALSRVIVVLPPRAEDALLASWKVFATHVLQTETIVELTDIRRTLVAVVVPGPRITLVTCARRDDEDCYQLALQVATRVLPERRDLEQCQKTHGLSDGHLLNRKRPACAKTRH